MRTSLFNVEQLSGNVPDSFERNTFLLDDENAQYAPSGTKAFFAWHKIRLIAQKRHPINWSSMVLQISHRARATVTILYPPKIAGAMMKSPLSVLAVNAPLPRTKAAMI